LRCKDIASAGTTVLSTKEMGKAVIQRLKVDMPEIEHH